MANFDFAASVFLNAAFLLKPSAIEPGYSPQINTHSAASKQQTVVMRSVLNKALIINNCLET